jgi:hypothetical protein
MGSAADRERQPIGGSPVVHVLLPFAAAYFLSYFYRSVNAVIAPDLARDFALSAASLGLLTSAYFLAFAAFQLPLGLLLDRFGPRRTDAALLLVAALGALVFACAGLPPLIAGRFIGLCVRMPDVRNQGQCHRFPLSRLGRMNGWMFRWRPGDDCGDRPGEARWSRRLCALFVVLALLTLAAALIFFFVPEQRGHGRHEPAAQLNGCAASMDRRFWQIARATTLQSTNVAVQGRAGPGCATWRLARDAVAFHLIVARPTSVSVLGPSPPGWCGTASPPSACIGGMGVFLCSAPRHPGSRGALLWWVGYGFSGRRAACLMRSCRALSTVGCGPCQHRTQLHGVRLGVRRAVGHRR